MTAIKDKFKDDDNPYFTLTENPVMFSDIITLSNSTLPSANAIMAESLWILGQLIENEQFKAMAESMLNGIFNQMISTGTFELISSNDLKTNLLEMFNHQKARNYATSVEIDNFNIEYRRGPFQNFRIRFDYNLMEGEFYGKRKLAKFQFNSNYYFSNEFYGLLSQAKLYSNMYRRQLNDILKTYNKTKTLIKFELDQSD